METSCILAIAAIGIAAALSAILFGQSARRSRRLADDAQAALGVGSLPPDGVVSTSISETRALAADSRDRAQGLSTSLESILNAIGSIRRESGNMARSGANLERDVELSASAIEELNASANTLSDLAVRQASAAEQSSAAIEQMSASTMSISKSVEGRQAANRDMANKAREGAETASWTAKVIEEFAQKATQMSEMVQAINDISASTNLLAMNAAIEAAHAGQYGRGFSVVADEIRKLAVTAGQRSSEIGKLLSAINGSISQAREAGKRSTDAFDSIARIVTEAVSSFDEMATGIHELSGGTVEIEKAVEQTSAAATEIRGSAGEIALAIGSIQKGILATKETAGVTERSIVALDAGIVKLNLDLLEASALNGAGSKNADKILKTLSGISTGSPSDGLPSGNLDVATARLQHKQWISKVLLNKAGALDLDPAIVADSHRCDLGAWLYKGGGLASIKGKIDTTTFQGNHDALHRLAADIIRDQTRDGLEDPRMVELESISERILEDLSRIK